MWGANYSLLPVSVKYVGIGYDLDLSERPANSWRPLAYSGSGLSQQATSLKPFLRWWSFFGFQPSPFKVILPSQPTSTLHYYTHSHTQPHRLARNHKLTNTSINNIDAVYNYRLYRCVETPWQMYDVVCTQALCLSPFKNHQETNASACMQLNQQKCVCQRLLALFLLITWQQSFTRNATLQLAQVLDVWNF